MVGIRIYQTPRIFKFYKQSIILVKQKLKRTFLCFEEEKVVILFPSIYSLPVHFSEILD